MDELGALTRDYRTTFLRYLPRHDETALAAAYDLGRRAVATGISLLDILSIHHTVLAEILHDSPDEMADIVPSAAAFLADALAPYDMASRAALGQRLSGGRRTASPRTYDASAVAELDMTRPHPTVPSPPRRDTFMPERGPQVRHARVPPESSQVLGEHPRRGGVTVTPHTKENPLCE